MLERLLITFLIGTLAVIAYLALNYRQRRQITTVTVSQTTEPLSRPRLLYFRSEGCGACLAQGHYLAQLDTPFQTLIEPVDVEQSPEVARQYGIMTLPTTILIDGQGSVRHINPGLANPFKLTRQLEALTTV